MNGIGTLRAKGFNPNVRGPGRFRQTTAATFFAWLAFASLGYSQPPAPAKESHPWDAIREKIRQPRDIVVRETGSGPELPLALTPDEVRDAANGIIRVDRFEIHLLDQIDKALAIMPQDLEHAESALGDLLRTHHSWRLSRTTQDAWRSLRIPLEQRLSEVRANRIAAADASQRVAMLPFARGWLRIHGPASNVGDAVKKWWLDEATRAVESNDGPTARRWHDRLVAEFGRNDSLAPLETQLRRLADERIKQSEDANASTAARFREEARAIWPESLARLKPLDSAKTLTVASRTLPRRFSPGAAKTDDERRCVELLFRSLDGIAVSKNWDANQLAWKDRIGSSHAWSEGTLITIDDVRHTFRLAESSHTWRLPLREMAATTSAVESRGVAIQLKHAAFPWRDLHALPIVPRLMGDKELAAWNDPAFASNPITSGRYRLAARNDKEPATLAFDPNPWDAIRPYFDRIEWAAADGVAKALAASKPDVAFDLDLEDANAFKKAGYTLRTTPGDRGWFLVLNHRRAVFANAEVRRGMAFAVERAAIVKLITLEGETASKPLAGPFAPESWQAATPPQAPASLDQLDAAIAQLRKANGMAATKLVLLFATDAPNAEVACKAMADQLNAACAKAELRVAILTKGLPAAELHSALDRRDFDLAYLPLDHGNDLWSLWSQFDRDPIALEAKGSNVSGFTDAKLESLFRSALASRRVSAVREATANIHAYFVETMPLIPLWRISPRIALAPTIDAPEIDPLHPFASIEDWKRKK